MIKIQEEVLNILKITGYDFEVVSHYINESDWHIEINNQFSGEYFITIFPDRWVVYKALNSHSGKALSMYTYTSGIAGINFTEALHKIS